jgi:hypothetical protein
MSAKGTTTKKPKRGSGAASSAPKRRTDKTRRTRPTNSTGFKKVKKNHETK